MKTKTPLATYESPQVTMISFRSEGILCSSLPKDFGWNNNHDGYTNGGDLDFSDWSN